MKFSLMVLPFLLCQWVTGQSVNSKSISIQLGDQQVRLQISEVPGEQIAYVHVHENETSSLEAGMTVLKKYGGKLVTLVHSEGSEKNRNVTFKHKKTIYRFDPNRIYSENDEVLRKAIQVVKGSGLVDEEILRMVKNLADSIWKEVSGFPLIVALHNNKNTGPSVRRSWLFWFKYEPESYNITSYVKKNEVSGEANLSCSDIYINPEINNSEFFIVTERRDFSLMYRKRFSVVLQNENPVDDGSMSVFAHKRSKRYINAEARHGKVSTQISMLELIHQL